MAPPANDDFANAQSISGLTGSFGPTTITDATTQVGEPSGDNIGANDQSIWFDWVAPSSTGMKIDTFDSTVGIYANVAVWTGGSLGTLVEVASNGSGGSDGFHSQVAFDAVSGTTYRIQACTYGGETGQITLGWAGGFSAPANDNFANAILISGLQGTTDSVDISFATGQASEPNPFFGSPPAYQTVWWKWVAPSSSDYPIVDFTWSNDAGFLDAQVYTGASVGALTAQGSRFTPTPGTTYYIQVGSVFGGDVTDVSVQWTMEKRIYTFWDFKWNGTSWNPVITDPHPARIVNFGMTRDSVRDKVVVAGGGTSYQVGSTLPTDPGQTFGQGGSSPDLNTTGFLDAPNDWVQQFPAANITVGPSVANCQICYDAFRDEIIALVKIAGVLQTWKFTTTWTQLTPAHSPEGMSSTAYGCLTYDTVRHKVIFAGTHSSIPAELRVWEWDGTDWTMSSTAARQLGAGSSDIGCAYDDTRHETVVFGFMGPWPSGAASATTYTWDGTTWTLKSPATSPTSTGTALTQFGMCFYPGTQRVVLQASSAGSGGGEKTWLWNGTTWAYNSDLPGTGTIGPGYVHNWKNVLAYDQNTGSLLCFGGYTFEDVPVPVPPSGGVYLMEQELN